MMSWRVEGIVPPDDKWEKMKAIWDAYAKTDMEVPDEVWQFFGERDPDESGTIIDIKDLCQEWGDMDRSGYELDVSKIPKHVKTIRFYTGW